MSKLIDTFNFSDISLLALISSNIIAIIFAVAFDWSLISILFLYWAQSVMIGFFTVLKMPFSKGDLPIKIFTIPFFIFHYGAFHFGYYLFIITSGLFGTLELINNYELHLTLIGFFIAGFISFLFNFKSDTNKDIGENMFSPYKRIVPMHLTIIFGVILIAFLPNAFGNKVVIILFLVLKTIVDVISHIKKHE